MTTATDTPQKANPAAQIHKLCARAAKAATASLRSVDANAAAEVDEVARWQPDKPVAVVVGETKRGKSSLVNALLGTPGLSPVDAAVATTAYLEFAYADEASVRAWQPGATDPMLLSVGDLRNWATRLGTMPPSLQVGQHFGWIAEREIVEEYDYFLHVFARLGRVADNERRGQQALFLQTAMGVHPVGAGLLQQEIVFMSGARGKQRLRDIRNTVLLPGRG
jgi:hypothetical protein